MLFVGSGTLTKRCWKSDRDASRPRARRCSAGGAASRLRDLAGQHVYRTVHAIFLDNVDIERQSLAEYVQSVPMGSPEQTLGNDPDKGFQPFFWLNTGGPLTRKDNGDRHHKHVLVLNVRELVRYNPL